MDAVSRRDGMECGFLMDIGVFEGVSQLFLDGS